ncbi:hypothetical protein OSB04_030480 [Centaurea solstitialis]|uniref:Uncharacterized protein n=1 Tax=Centaurea solstitialis TaxID=347529 RepID=A0AA38SR66_9ASTR|nr:hypothetical protein OSB04_030480 [Centaurea solstitialis]
MDVFSKSSREEDDEEALKWASLEKLPTFDRLRKGLLFGSQGRPYEVDVDNLGVEDRKRLVDRLVKVADEDNEKFLLKLRNRIDRMIEVGLSEINEYYRIVLRVGIDLPTIEVKFEHMTVEADVNTGSRALPSFINFHIDIFENDFTFGSSKFRENDTIVGLGGKLDKNLTSSGRVTYNGHELHEFVPERTSAYISQNDVHIGEMTVRETLAFSARCQGVGSRYEMLAELSRREKDANIKPDPDIDVFMKAAATEGQEASVVTEYAIKLLGLDICADTMVGDQMVRGISGGQKKRVTTGEMIVGPSNVLLMDEISTGLDKTYELFDDIILLTDGKIVYQGPRDNVLEFFESMGFKCPERKGVADFLQEVTSKKDQQQYWMRRDEHYRFVTAKEFAEAFQSFHVGKRLGDDLATQYDKSRSHPAALQTRSMLFIMSFVTMTVFLRSEMSRDTVEDGWIYMGALFFGVFMIMFNGMPEISMTIQKLPVFYKQRDFLFYPAWAYALPTWIIKIPISFVEAAVWTSLTYYVVGFEPSVSRFFRQYFLLFGVNQMSSALFRFIGSMGRNMIVANTFGSFALLLVFVMDGFVLSEDDVKKWWLWGYWTSPMMYAMNGMFKGGIELGRTIITSRGFIAEGYWYWIAIVALFGFIILYNFCFTICLTFLDPYGKSRSIVSSQNGSDAGATELSPTTGSADGSNGTKKKGMILPFEPHYITFNDVKYSVDMPQEMREQGVNDDKLLLLKSVSGAFRPGVLTALMGVSGAGKTTLMDVLAGRKTGGYIEGDIRISGYPKKQATFARISGYCEQNDIHSPHVTVYESLLYSAWLRLSTGDEGTRKMFVEEVMELVELNPLRDALVGLPGLDARAAAIVMRTVRNTVDTGRTVVCTIHQPSIDLFEAFDELFLLKRGGEEIYVGPVGRHSCELIKYFEDIDGVRKIKDGYNPATWMLEISTSAQETAIGVNFSEIYRNSHLFTRNKAMIAELSVPRPGTKDLYFPTQYSQPFVVQCLACLWKQRQSYWRNPSYTAVRFAFTTFIAFMFGTIFWNIGGKRKTPQQLNNAMGSMYAAVLFLGVQNGSAVQPIIDVERTVFYRERAAGMYSALPYAFGQVVVEIPYILSQTIVYCIIVYAMIGFEWTANKFFWYTFFQFCNLLYMTFYGMMTVAISPNVNVAFIVAAAFFGFFNLFSGFIVPRPKIPMWWRWYYWCDPLAWTIYGMAMSQFGDYDDMFAYGETVKGYLDRYLGYKQDFLGQVAAANIGFVLAFGLIFAFCIKTFNFQKR